MALFHNEIEDSTNVLNALMDGPDVFKSRHPTIFNSVGETVRFSAEMPPKETWMPARNVTTEALNAFSVLVHADLDRETDLLMINKWIKALSATEQQVRLGIVPRCLRSTSRLAIIKKVYEGRIKSEELESMLDPQGPPNEDLNNNELLTWCRSLKMSQMDKDLDLGPVVSINGRLFGPFPMLAEVIDIDVENWLRLEWRTRAQRLQILALKSSFEKETMAITQMTVFEGEIRSLIKSHQHLFSGNQAMEVPADKLNHFRLTSSTPLLRMNVMINPFSLTSAKLSAILIELDDLIGGHVILNVLPQYQQSPAKGIYRFKGLAGDLGLMLQGTQMALMINSPSSWDLDDASDDLDVDNIVYKGELDYRQPSFFLRGFIAEVETRYGENGPHLPAVPVQLRLGDKLIDEALSISLRGYTQLRGPSGIFSLQVQENGKIQQGRNVTIVLDSLAINKAILPLQSIINDPRIFQRDKITNLYICIVSGATYERLVRIMMMSVMKNTRSSVKFWLISNFQTPAFERSIAILSRSLNFSYEFVRFRWPGWLNAQWRKHRRVWAHKILFLDALPYAIDRLIYIDADQVVRSDVKELHMMDLKGRVYGFVPFCESRKETAHLRFWQEGYWAEHLKGLPYHISALFVVDMRLFRAQAVGDRLRTQYQTLSYDPNSLANLDQDLPNNLQHEIPIHALPSEWLWCETWCGDASKPRAKSIDLCSNPLRAEDKLQQARRIIPEWTKYDMLVHNILGDTASSTDDDFYSHDEL